MDAGRDARCGRLGLRRYGTSQAGQFISQAYVVGGDSKTWTFQQAVNMQIGNPGGIVLTVNGKRVGSPGSAGQPVTLSLGPGRPVSG